MQERDVILTWEAIHDVAGIAEYIELKFGRERADRYEKDIKRERIRKRNPYSASAKGKKKLEQNSERVTEIYISRINTRFFCNFKFILKIQNLT